MENEYSNIEHVNQEKAKIVEALRELLKWKDEIPERMVSSTDLVKDYKVRTAWWYAVVLQFEQASKFGLFTEQIRERVLNFRDEYTSEHREGGRLVIKEDDIKKANELIEDVIEELGESELY